MFYKTDEIAFLLQQDISVCDLCFYNSHYYFSSEAEITGYTKIDELEFLNAINSIHHIDENTEECFEFKPTQLDLIQVAVEKSNSELRQEGADAIVLELIASGII